MPTTSAGLEYQLLEEELLSGRSLETLDESSEEALLSAMDVLWWRMTKEERVEADARPVAPVDTATDLGQDRADPELGGWPRELVAA